MHHCSTALIIKLSQLEKESIEMKESLCDHLIVTMLLVHVFK